MTCEFLGEQKVPTCEMGVESSEHTMRGQHMVQDTYRAIPYLPIVPFRKVLVPLDNSGAFASATDNPVQAPSQLP